MDKPPNPANDSPDVGHSRPSSNGQNLYPTLSRESTASSATITPRTDSWPSKPTTQTSASSSAAASPLPSREPSPTRPRERTSTSRTSSTNPGTRSRKNSQQDVSPSRTTTTKSNLPTLSSTSRTLSSANTPSLLPTTSDPNIRTPVPVKSPTTLEHLRESPRWPVSPRLKSPPPILNRPNLPPPRRGDWEAPSINIQRATPPQPSPPPQDTPSDTDPEDAQLQAGVRTPVRAAGGTSSTLETVQEVSPLGSPNGPEDPMEEKFEDSIISEASAQLDPVDISVSKSVVGKANLAMNESGSESGSIKDGRRPGTTSAPPLTARQSSASIKPSGTKGKAGEAVSLQSMTVETETVTSIPQVALAPGVGAQGTNGSLRTKQSSETIRPKKDRKKAPRKQPAVTAGTGEPLHPATLQLRLRHHQSMRSVSSITETRISPTKYGAQGCDDSMSPGPRSPGARSRSLVSYQMSTLLTRRPPASSKADIFEAKVASAVEEANSSDSEETFVYDSNPPDHRDRPQRFHSRTPSATSMASQIDRSGLRSIHTVMENAAGQHHAGHAGPPHVAVKRSMKFVNSYNSIGNGNENVLVEEEGNGSGTGRSNIGSTRGTARHHHHFGRWGRNGGGNGHPSLFAEHSPFASTSLAAGSHGARQSPVPGPGPASPRVNGRPMANGSNKRVSHLSAPGYDLDDTTTGADDETTPLIHNGTMRSARSGRSRRGMHALRTMEQQNYRPSHTSLLNRFASCLVLTVMLLLVVSGAIGFMFATSQPLTDVRLIAMDHVVASEQELMLDLTVEARNPNVVVVTVDAADIEVFAKSIHAGTDSEWWRIKHPGEGEPILSSKRRRRRGTSDVGMFDDSPDDPQQPPEDAAPNMRLGTIEEFDSALSFEGSFFHTGISTSTGEVRLRHPGNGTYGGQERWENIMKDEFTLILKGVLRYTLPLSQRVRTATISGKTTVKPNAANDPSLRPNMTGTFPKGEFGISSSNQRQT